MKLRLYKNAVTLFCITCRSTTMDSKICSVRVTQILDRGQQYMSVNVHYLLCSARLMYSSTLLKTVPLCDKSWSQIIVESLNFQPRCFFRRYFHDSRQRSSTGYPITASPQNATSKHFQFSVTCITLNTFVFSGR